MNYSDKNIFAQQLVKLRKANNLSQYSLAEKLGFSRGLIANYEQGRREPDYANLKIIADYFNVTTDYLLGHSSSSSVELTNQDKKDIAKDLEKFKKELLESDELMFDGHPMSEDSINNILAALEIGMEQVRRKNKIKYNPKKFKNNEE